MDFNLGNLERRFNVKAEADDSLDIPNLPPLSKQPGSLDSGPASSLAGASSSGPASSGTAGAVPAAKPATSLPPPSSTPSFDFPTPSLASAKPSSAFGAPATSSGASKAADFDFSALSAAKGPSASAAPSKAADFDFSALSAAKPSPNSSSSAASKATDFDFAALSAAKPSSVGSVMGSGASKASDLDFDFSALAKAKTASADAPSVQPKPSAVSTPAFDDDLDLPLPKAAPTATSAPAAPTPASNIFGTSTISLGATPGIPGSKGGMNSGLDSALGASRPPSSFGSMPSAAPLRRGGPPAAKEKVQDEFDEFFDGPAKPAARKEKPTGLMPASKPPLPPAQQAVAGGMKAFDVASLPQASLPQSTSMPPPTGPSDLSKRMAAAPPRPRSMQPSILAAFAVLICILAGVLYVGDMEEISWLSSQTSPPDELEIAEHEQAHLAAGHAAELEAKRLEEERRQQEEAGAKEEEEAEAAAEEEDEAAEDEEGEQESMGASAVKRVVAVKSRGRPKKSKGRRLLDSVHIPQM